MNENLKREYEKSIFRAFGVSFKEYVYLIRWRIENDIFFNLCLSIGLTHRKEECKRNINTLLSEYMYNITPFI